MRWALSALGLMFALGACTSDGTSAFERLGPQAKEVILGSDDEPAEAPPEITRAQLEQVPFATISVQVGDFPRALVVAVADNEGHVVYQDTTRRSMVLKGGLLSATHGLGYNLSAIKHQADDPVVAARPVAEWPRLITRNYQFSLANRDDYQITVRCRYQQVAREQIEIIELSFDLLRIEEVCGNGRRTFTNTYWAEPETGFIWKSNQWIGPKHDLYVIEIVRPYRKTG